MERVLRELIDLQKVKALEQSECQEPGEILGAHMEKVGCMISAYLPDAKQVSVAMDGERYPMERVDSEGFFAVVLVDQMRLLPYKFYAEYENGDTEVFEDPYSHRFPSQFTDADLRKFHAGTFYRSYEKLGARPMTIADVEGVHFAVWAPEAKRVSVVGEFNYWNGKRHQMKRVGDTGLYELFIPGLTPGLKYKFEVKTPNGDPMLKADPYAFQTELRPDTASVICGLGSYVWKDEAWMEQREQNAGKDRPLSIYEVHLGSWMQKPLKKTEDGTEVNGSQFFSYEELAEKLSAYVKEMGYTHIELMPVMEHPLDASWGYQITGYYAPTSRFGTPDEFRGFMDRMHQEGIGVILDWVPAHFPKDAHGLATFDGTCLYEHADPRMGEQPKWDMLNFNYRKPQVSNFLISNALYWAKEFHVDGIRANAVASMLYLDYGKNAGEWIANLYGGRENLDAVEFLKHLNSIFHKEVKGAVMIAEESTAWPRITGSLDEEGLGFDYKWNTGWTNDFLRYMQCDPYYRHEQYGDMTFSMLYAYSEDFIQAFSHNEVVQGSQSMIEKMPGEDRAGRFANLRAAYGFQMGHPGKKLLFMGQEFAQPEEWTETKGLDWNLLEASEHAQMKAYVKAWNHLYRKYPALYEQDFEPEGFQWINCTYDKENIVVFQRCGKQEEDTLLIVGNFIPVARERFRVGVPFAGTYEEILNSDAEIFGGSGMTNPQAIASQNMGKDGRANSMELDLAPMSVCVFRYVPKPADQADEKPEKEQTKNTISEKTGGESQKKLVLPAINPAKTAKAASEAIAQKGADALDKLSETVGKIINKKK